MAGALAIAEEFLQRLLFEQLVDGAARRKRILLAEFRAEILPVRKFHLQYVAHQILQQLAADLRLDTEHQFLPLRGRFHGLGRELRRTGDVGHRRRNHVLGRGIECDVYLAAQRHFADHRLG